MASGMWGRFRFIKIISHSITCACMLYNVYTLIDAHTHTQVLGIWKTFVKQQVIHKMIPSMDILNWIIRMRREQEQKKVTEWSVWIEKGNEHQQPIRLITMKINVRFWFVSVFFSGNMVFLVCLESKAAKSSIVTPLRSSVFRFDFFLWFCDPQVTLLTLSHMEYGFRETYFTDRIRSRNKIWLHTKC